MATNNVGGGSVRRGEVRSVRELKNGIQAQVCIGADVQHGYATMVVVCSEPEVLAAMDQLKAAIRTASFKYIEDVLAGQAEWDADKAHAAALRERKS